MRRTNRYHRRGADAGFAGFIIVIILAIAVGYAGTKFILYPYLLGTGASEHEKKNGTDQTVLSDSAVSVIPDAPSVIIDQQDLKNGTTTENGKVQTNPDASASDGPFSVQFGSFSEQTGAEDLSVQLSGKGIYSYVYKSSGSYKVLGLPYAAEEKAKQAALIVSAAVPDVFVVNLSDIIP